MNDTPIHVLLIEDDPGYALLFRKMLLRTRGGSFDLEQANRLSSGLEYLARGGIDVVVLDLSLPDSQGFETFEHTRAQAPGVPIVLLTALADESLAVKAVREGAQDYLVKGEVDSNLLARSIRYAIERKCAEATLEQERAMLAQRVEERTADLRAANEELARAARLKDEFLANLSHELRTPLNAILSLSETLQEGVYGPLNERQARTLHSIEESGRRLLSLINDIIDLARIGADKLEMTWGPVSVMPVCQASLKFIAEAASRKRIKVSATFDNEVTTLQADERRLKQILVNLLSNAIKFTPEGGAIGLEVTGDPQQQMVHVTVWDSGIGISQEDRQRIFQPFTQLDGSLSRQYPGLGLGLSLARRLTEMHGGRVLLESEPGKGSRFTVSLPWKETSRPADKETIPSPPKEQELAIRPPTSNLRPLESASVLLAEDNESVMEAFSEFLLTRGYRVFTAGDGQEAIERARMERPDVIIMDAQMPGMDGLEAMRRIRADAELTHIPIIILTGLVMPGDRERCLEAGANDHLSKPVSLKGLAKAIEAQLNRPTAV